MGVLMGAWLNHLGVFQACMIDNGIWHMQWYFIIWSLWHLMYPPINQDTLTWHPNRAKVPKHLVERHDLDNRWVLVWFWSGGAIVAVAACGASELSWNKNEFWGLLMCHSHGVICGQDDSLAGPCSSTTKLSEDSLAVSVVHDVPISYDTYAQSVSDDSFIHDFSKKSLATQPQYAYKTRNSRCFCCKRVETVSQQTKTAMKSSISSREYKRSNWNDRHRTNNTIDPRPPRTWFVAWASSGGIKGYSGSAGSLLSSLSRQNMVQNVRYENCCKSLGLYCHMLRKNGRYRERERERETKKDRQTDRQTDR